MDVWPFIPQSAMVESLEWQTDIIECKTAEQRACLRTAPRQGWQYKHLLTEAQYGAAKDLARKTGVGPIMVPIWAQGQELGGVASGTGIIAVDTDREDYVQPGSMVFIYESPAKYELLSIASVVSGLVTFPDYGKVVNTYTNAFVMPAKEGTFSQFLDGGLSAFDRVKGNAQFRMRDSRNLTTLTGLTFPTHKAIQVLNIPSVLNGDLTERQNTEFEALDSITGPVFQQATKSGPTRETSFVWCTNDKDELWNLRVWLHQLKGKQKKFWTLGWNSDVTVTKAILVDDTTVEIAACHYQEWNPTTTDLAIFTADGGLYFCRSLSCTAGNAGKEVLHLEESVGPAIPLGSITRVTRMTLSRWETDRFEIQYKAGGVAMVIAPLKEVPL